MMLRWGSSLIRKSAAWLARRGVDMLLSVDEGNALLSAR
jgi:hypothetical protein